MQHAVITEPQPEAVFQRLDVNVRGLKLDSVRDDLVDEADDRGLAGKVAQPLSVFLHRFRGVPDRWRAPARSSDKDG